MADSAFTIDAAHVGQTFAALNQRILRRAVNAAATTQLQQVADAFRNGGQPSRKWPALSMKRGYRAGGQPLVDTGQLRASFFSKERTVSRKEAVSVIASSAFYAAWHQDGFHTQGPNYIPLTLRGRTLHHKGADPASEGLVRGKDYLMAWKGVNVPKRPMIDYRDPVNKREIEAAIQSAITKG